MRHLGKVESEKLAYRLYNFLKKEGIDTFYEKTNGDYSIWVVDEDAFDAASQMYTDFMAAPDEARFDAEEAPPPAEEQVEELLDASRLERIKKRVEERQVHVRSYFGWTRFIIGLCVALFFVTMYQSYKLRQNDAVTLPFTHLEKAFFFEYPSAFEQGHGLIWPGLYTIILDWPQSRIDLQAPMFEQIAQGQLWRLITPVFLHAGVLHLLFNMMWLWLLGKQVEERAGVWRYLLLSLIIGVISNTAQYLMSGFSFIGYSGIICGLAGYIWIRQKVAPWEGYPLQKGTAFFLMIFVLGVAAMQVISFLLSYTGLVNITLPFANTAHVVGALVGMGLARIPMFAK
ncbi:MAG: rhomboid family intramembrane serine protease [Simkaniaceae bacterium]|nr:rhomboid family intramembrane serine protease [Simkaniaceae bacterium]